MSIHDASFFSDPHSPFWIAIFQYLTSACLIAFTSKTSILRLMFVPLLIGCVYRVVVDSPHYLRSMWALILAAQSLSYMLDFFDRGLFNSWTFETHAPYFGFSTKGNQGTVEKQNGTATKPKGMTDYKPSGQLKDTPLNRLFFGIKTMFDIRYLNTVFEVKNCPNFSDKDPSYVPSYSGFLIRCALISTFCSLILDVSTSQPTPNPEVLFSNDRVHIFSRLGSVTGEEIAIRVGVTLATWVTAYCMIAGMAAFCAFIAVGLTISQPIAWRPLFGSITEAYTVRRFWGTFWHQLLRKYLTENASFIANRLMRIPKGTLASRYSNLVLCFAISGLLHNLAEISYGQSMEDTIKLTTLRFFVVQALGIMLEDAVEALYGLTKRKLQGRAGQKQNDAPPIWVKILGYIWTAAFLIWSTPLWSFPIAASVKPDDNRDILPFKIFVM